MPLLEVRLTDPFETIELNWGPEGFSRVRLIRYYGAGMLPGNPPLFMRIENQHETTVYGNCGNRIMLIFQSDGTNPCMPNNIPSSGHRSWSDSRQLKFRIENFDYSPATFTELFLSFEGVEKMPQQPEWTPIDAYLFQA